jgi:hypothetical protein
MLAPTTGPAEEHDRANSPGSRDLVPSARGRHRRAGGRSWVCVAEQILERVLTSWPTTLRAALLLVILLGSLTIALVVILGAVPAACIAGLGLVVKLFAAMTVRRRTA